MRKTREVLFLAWNSEPKSAAVWERPRENSAFGQVSEKTVAQVMARKPEQARPTENAKARFRQNAIEIGSCGLEPRPLRFRPFGVAKRGAAMGDGLGRNRPGSKGRPEPRGYWMRSDRKAETDARRAVELSKGAEDQRRLEPAHGRKKGMILFCIGECLVDDQKSIAPLKIRHSSRKFGMGREPPVGVARIDDDEDCGGRNAIERVDIRNRMTRRFPSHAVPGVRRAQDCNALRRSKQPGYNAQAGVGAGKRDDVDAWGCAIGPPCFFLQSMGSADVGQPMTRFCRWQGRRVGPWADAGGQVDPGLRRVGVQEPRDIQPSAMFEEARIDFLC